MKRIIPATRDVDQAFTLIEMLVVIAIIGILAAMLLPALSKAKIGAQKKISQSEEGNLVAAISAYYGQYSRLPVSSGATAAAGTNDFTCGTLSNVLGNVIPFLPNLPQIQSYEPVPSGGKSSFQEYQNYNSEVIAILRDDNYWPEANNGVPVCYNPQHTPFFSAKIGTTNSDGTGTPGIGPDDVFRDPWGSPYIITLDLNGDNKCMDFALNSMYSNNVPKPTGPWLIPGQAIVWSFGPYWKSGPVSLSTGLNTGANKLSIVTSF